MKNLLAVVVMLFMSITAFASCDSLRFSYSDGWKPAASAPHDGTTVEMMETFGIAPWYGIFKWTKDTFAQGPDGKLRAFKTARPSWVQVDNPGNGVDEDECLFWRPYKSSSKYVDPTKGAQKGTEYWCAAAHVPYDPKTGYCKK